MRCDFIIDPSASFESKRNISEVIIRTALLEDVSSVAELLTITFHPPEGFLYWLNPLLKLGITEDLRHRFRSCVPYYRCLVATVKQEIVGTVEIALSSFSPWTKVHHRYLYISNLAVSDRYRRQGIAQKLLLKCDRIAFEWGFEEIRLHVLDNNYNAQQLYFKSGYQLHQIELNLAEWVLQRPKRLLLSKKFTTS